MTYGLSNIDWQIIRDTAISPLNQHNCTIWIFGSRAKGTHRKFSDLDILYQEREPLPPGFIAEIKMKLEESDVSVKVDLVNIRDLSESYRDDVLKTRKLLSPTTST